MYSDSQYTHGEHPAYEDTRRAAGALPAIRRQRGRATYKRAFGRILAVFQPGPKQRRASADGRQDSLSIASSTVVDDASIDQMSEYLAMLGTREDLQKQHDGPWYQPPGKLTGASETDGYWPAAPSKDISAPPDPLASSLDAKAPSGWDSPPGVGESEQQAWEMYTAAGAEFIAQAPLADADWETLPTGQNWSLPTRLWRRWSREDDADDADGVLDTDDGASRRQSYRRSGENASWRHRDDSPESSRTSTSTKRRSVPKSIKSQSSKKERTNFSIVPPGTPALR
ncbi:hypothetical protein FA95DRAFT_1560816 [Auriscalpium vulgare]|uniref:Uncharacterized protein n=1 Tax=Auriscalpium vulgare TaxID=40419 RepID=A0ACB8RP49_9AGAM|nr:hypothetical protein FA95DRAFT_1560816 [Auriscalpium vulgare]